MADNNESGLEKISGLVKDVTTDVVEGTGDLIFPLSEKTESEKRKENVYASQQLLDELERGLRKTGIILPRGSSEDMEVKSTEPWRFIPSKERLEKMFTHEEETFEEEKLNELFQIGGDLDPTSWTAKSPAELKADEQARLNAEEDRLRGDLLDKNNRLLGLRQPEWTGNIDTSSLKPFDKDLYEQKPDEKQLWVYYPYKDSGGYEMPNRNNLEAFSSADAVYSDLKTTGSRYWIPAFRKLDTLQRGLLALQGDPKGVTELLRREARDDYKKNLAWVKRQRLPTIGGAAQPMDDDTAEWIANHITLAEHYAFAMPNYMYSASGRLLGGIDSVLNIIPQWDGLLIDTLVAVANDTQEGFALEEKIEDQVLGQDSNSGIYILDDDIFGPTTTALTHHSPFARMSADELEGMIKHSEDPNLTTKIIRTFLDEFGIVASLVMGVGTGSNILGWGARMERTALLALEKKGIKASEKTVLQEMRNIIQATYKEQIKETQTKITPWLKKQYDLARSEWYLNPIKYLNDLAQTEGAFVAGAEMTSHILENRIGGLHTNFGEFETLGTTFDLDEGAETVLEIMGGLAGVITHTIGKDYIYNGINYGARVGNELYRGGINLPVMNVVVKPFFDMLNLGPDAIRKALISGKPLLDPALNIDPSTRKTLRRMARTLLKIQDDQPESIASMLESSNFYNQLKEEGEKYGYTIPQAIESMGMVFRLRELRSAETKMMAEGRALKLGTNMKFLTHMIILNHTRQSIELQIAEAIAEMPEIEKGREMPMLNRLKDILTLQQAEMEAERAMRNELLNRAVSAQFMYHLHGWTLNADTESGKELFDLLQKYKEYNLTPDELKQVQAANTQLKESKLNSATTRASLNAFRRKIAELNEVTPENIDKYVENPEEGLLMENANTATDIKNYTSKVFVNNMVRTHEFGELHYGNLYDTALKAIAKAQDPAVSTVDIVNLALNINRGVREGVFMVGGKDVFTEISEVVKEPLQKQYDEMIEQVQASIDAAALQTGQEIGDPSTGWFSVKERIQKEMLENDQYAARTKDITLLDKIEYVATMPLVTDSNLEFTMKIPFEKLHDLRKKTRKLARVAFDAKESSKGNRLTELSNDMTAVIDPHIAYVKSSKNPKLVEAGEAFEEAETMWEMHVANRLRENESISLLDGFNRPVGKQLDKDRGERSKLSIEIVDPNTGLPKNKLFEVGNWISGRMIANDEEYLDTLFETYSATRIFNNLATTYGTPKKVVEFGKERIKYRFPTEHEPRYEPFMAAIELLNTYISAKWATNLDQLAAQGKLKWIDEISQETNLAGIQEAAKFGQLPPELIASGDKSMLNFAKKVQLLDRKIQKIYSNDNRAPNFGPKLRLIGADVANQIPTLQRNISDLQKVSVATLRRLGEAVKQRQQDSDRTIHFIKILQGLQSTDFSAKRARLQNAESYVDMALADLQDTIPTEKIIAYGKAETATDVYSPILEKLIKSAVESGAGTETEVRQLFSDILALGTVDKFTHLSTEWEWENKELWDSIISKTKKEKGMLSRAAGAASKVRESIKDLTESGSYFPDDTMTERYLNETDMKRDLIRNQKNTDASPKTQKYVDGPALYEHLTTHYDFYKKYMNNSLDELLWLVKVAMVTTDPKDVLDTKHLRSPSYGMMNIQPNTVQSRAAGVYNKRASIRWPLIEMSWALLSHREADALTALLANDGLYIAAMTEVMTTGAIDGKKYRPKLFESFFADAVTKSSDIAQGFYEANREYNDIEGHFLDALILLLPEEYAPKRLFPNPPAVRGFPFRLQKKPDGNYGWHENAQNARVQNKREDYRKFLSEMFTRNRRTGEDFNILLESIQTYINNLPQNKKELN